MQKDYPEYRDHLRGLVRKLAHDLPGPISAFGQLHDRSLADGALSGKVKELIALGIGITSRCDGCIAYHVHDAVKAGATRAEILETIGVAVMMGGGPASVYGCEALAALEQFEVSGQ
ncbi:MAG: Carboxymuconolactone decarboxylase family protein [Armatimonadetes bacterium]|jgi:AhpD family alkylhydroperoxidase|nr:Carboxymuconolactone decarboxylase family protein [Armatimonadota bacterium]